MAQKKEDTAMPIKKAKKSKKPKILQRYLEFMEILCNPYVAFKASPNEVGSLPKIILSPN